MPEVPPDYEDFLPIEDRDDHFVNLQMPRSALRSLERDARAWRQAVAEAEQRGVDLTPDGDTPLEPGEADLTRSRRELANGAPPDQVQPSDPYAEAERNFDRVLEQGGHLKDAGAAAFRTVVEAAIRGDRRVIVREAPGTKGDG